MRIIPVLTAICVAAFFYVFIVERDWLLGAAAETPPPNGQTPETPPADAARDGDANTIRVLALKSVARTVEDAVKLRGETQAARQVEVRTETSARVASHPLRKGTYVREGQVLCELEPGTRAAQLAEAEAALRVAEIDVNAAEKLSKGGFAAETRVAGAKAALAGAQARVAAVTRDIENLTVSAPFDGLLESDAAEMGSLMQPGALCATVIDLDPIKVVGFVPEPSIGLVEVGAMTVARLSNGQELRGRVGFLSRSADPTTRTFRVEVEVPNSDLSVRSGQTLEIIIAAPGSDAHLLPQSALTLDDDGRLGVRVAGADHRVKFIPVQVLRDTPDGVWLGGLPAEVDVIIRGQEYVTDGVVVTPVFEGAAE